MTTLKAGLLAACALAAAACAQDAKTQVVTGRLSTKDAIAVRAVDGTTIVTAARVRANGTFTLSLPAHHQYRLEVLTSTGVHNLIGANGGSYADVTFSVCAPQDPFDMGGMCDPNDPNNTCKPDGAPTCDPMTDPTCSWCNDPGDPNCGGTGCADPNSPDCKPLPCDPNTDPMCVPPCDPTMDPSCGGTTCNDPNDPNCAPPPPCDPATDPMCKCWPGDPNCPSCDPMLDPMCQVPPPPCTDPMDPNTCKDPCMTDPVACGCAAADGTIMGSGTNAGSDPTTCWPAPEPCAPGGQCAGDPWWPEHPPTDFGCGDDGNIPSPAAGTTMPEKDPSP